MNLLDAVAVRLPKSQRQTGTSVLKMAALTTCFLVLWLSRCAKMGQQRLLFVELLVLKRLRCPLTSIDQGRPYWHCEAALAELHA